MTLQRPACAFGVLAGLALGCSTPSPSAGVETGPCLAGECFDGLSCLSDLCVGDDTVASGTTGDNTAGGGEGNGGNGSSPGAPTGADPEDGGAADANSGTGPGDDSDGPNDPTTGDPTAGLETCDAIDFLFVIDNSGSMTSEQARLVAALPDFIADIDARIGPSDPHFMVTDVDAWPFAPCDQGCAPPAKCINGGVCNVFFGDCARICGAALTCGAYPCGAYAYDACEAVLGAGVDRPLSIASAGESCGFTSGKRFIDASQPDLVDTLVCAAQVGIDSATYQELPMQALLEAIRTDGDVGACNDGFLRDGAMLVVVFVTNKDDPNGASEGNPALWHTALLQAKGGDPNAIAVLGMFGDGDLAFSQCDAAPSNDSAEDSQRMRAFLQLWGDNGVFGSVCAPNYAPAFAETVDVVQDLCATL